LEAHRYHLEHHLLPMIAPRRMSAVTVADVATLLGELRAKGCSAKTAAGALATPHSIIRYARRRGWIAIDPVDPSNRTNARDRCGGASASSGAHEIQRLLAACAPRDRLMIATALFTGLRISELLGLIWDDVDLDPGVIHVRAQLSRAHRDDPPRRVATKTPASVRDVPLVPQLAMLLAEHQRRSRFVEACDWLFATVKGTLHGERNVTLRGLQRAARRAGIDNGNGPALHNHDLRHTFASHLILDLGLDVAQTSCILGHASSTITLDVYTHLFEQARHMREIRARMAAGSFAQALDPVNCAPIETPLRRCDRTAA
jgi:integrase